MAQTFNNGESNASIRTKLNANATELNSTTNLMAGKATPADIETALDNSTIYFDETTFEGAVYPVPVGEEPAVGTIDNPIKAINAGTVTVVDAIVDGNPNAVSSNAVYDGIEAVKGGTPKTIKQVYDELYALIQSGKETPLPPTSAVINNSSKTFGFTNVGGLANSDTEITFDGGLTFEANSANPFSVPNEDFAIDTVGVRYKETVDRNPSNWLFNPTPYTESVDPGENYLTGFDPLDITNGLLSNGANLVDNEDGTWTATGSNVGYTSLYLMKDLDEIALFNTDTSNSGGGIGVLTTYEINNIFGIELIAGQLYAIQGGGEPTVFEDSIAVGEHVVIRFNYSASAPDSKLNVYKVASEVYTLMPLPDGYTFNYLPSEIYVAGYVTDGKLYNYPQGKGLEIADV